MAKNAQSQHTYTYTYTIHTLWHACLSYHLTLPLKTRLPRAMEHQRVLQIHVELLAAASAGHPRSDAVSKNQASEVLAQSRTTEHSEIICVPCL